MVETFLGKRGAPIKSQEMMYNAVVQVLLLYGRKIWVVADVIMTVLEIFHNSINRQIAGMTSRKGNNGEWEWA